MLCRHSRFVQEFGVVRDPEKRTAIWKKVFDPGLTFVAEVQGKGPVVIYRVQVEGGELLVDMTMTSPGCPVAEQLLFEANNAILKVPGVERASVNLVWDPPWTPEKMSLEARMMLGFA